MPSKPITYHGVNYASRRALCKEYGIDEKRVESRLRAGWTLEEAVETEVGERVTNGIPVEYEGISYPSLKNMAEELGFSRSILQQAYYRTKDIKEAVEYCLKYEKRDLTVWGRTYQSLSEVALLFGISHYRLTTQVREGKKLEEAVKEALETEPIVFEGRRYAHFVDLCGAYGIQPVNVYFRLEYGMDLREALTRPIKRTGGRTQISYQGREYESQTDLCRSYGISVLCVREQTRTNPLTFLDSFEVLEELKRRLGMKAEEMLNYIPHCRIRGKNYKTVAELLREFDITATAFYSRKSRSEDKDVFAVLKGMQAETRRAYEVEGQPMLREEVRRLHYKEYQIDKLPRCELPKYPKLAGFDLDTKCYDSERLYYELLNKKLEEQEQVQEESSVMRIE
ncbi:hypothetical protein D5278_06760 [bacterium 1XD21-13]|nr:hypothetical protein [bacterium 1XD21-13]